MEDKIIILKIGGSSITNKAQEETLDTESLEWFANLISTSVNESVLSPSSTFDRSSNSQTKPRLIIVPGAGSFGHHSAKRYGLKCGKAVLLDESESMDEKSSDDTLAAMSLQYQMEGLSKTRHSVQKLNSAIVDSLLNHGVNAVGLSPGMSIPSLRAHGATKRRGEECASDSSIAGMKLLCQSIHQSLKAGLLPVIHGDACLLYDGKRAGILGGDTFVEGIATLWDESTTMKNGTGGLLSPNKISQVIFITDVAGVFTSDPKSDPNAELIRHLNVNCTTGELSIVYSADNMNRMPSSASSLNVSGSSHAHDVTGGLKVKKFIYLCSWK
jgi:isopentenyl phosphate kinase